MSRFTAKVARACLLQAVPFWVENPDSSWLWLQPEWLKITRLLERRILAAAPPASACASSCGDPSPSGSERDRRFPACFRVDFCRWGTPWRKRTRFLTTLTDLQGARLLCNCARPTQHQRLRGRAPDGRAWTLIAQPYPKAFARVLGMAAASAAGLSTIRRRRLDIGACAQASCSQIGEAPHPGPQRRTAAPRDLARQELVLAANRP